MNSQFLFYVKKLYKHRYLVLIATVLLTVFLRIGLSNWVARNSIGASVLAAELVSESIDKEGFKEAREHYAQNLRKYTDYIDHGLMSSLFAFFNPSYGLDNQLESIFAALEMPYDSEEKAGKAICEAGQQVISFSKRAERRPSRHFIWFVSKSLPAPLQKALDDAVGKSEKLVDQLAEGKPNFAKVREVHMANMESMFLVTLAWHTYGSNDRIEEFRNTVELTRLYNRPLARKMKNAKNKQEEYKLLVNWDQNDKYRVDVLHAMLEGNRNVVRNLSENRVNEAIATPTSKPPKWRYPR